MFFHGSFVVLCFYWQSRKDVKHSSSLFPGLRYIQLIGEEAGSQGPSDYFSVQRENTFCDKNNSSLDWWHCLGLRGKAEMKWKKQIILSNFVDNSYRYIVKFIYSCLPMAAPMIVFKGKKLLFFLKYLFSITVRARRTVQLYREIYFVENSTFI